MAKNKKNIICDSCGYKAYSSCLGSFGYCEPAVCNTCKKIYDINSEFCGDPKQVNSCTHCQAYNYSNWDQEKSPCPKCNNKMKIVLTDWLKESVSY